MLSRIEPQGTCTADIYTCCFARQKFSQNNEFKLYEKHGEAVMSLMIF